MMLIAYSKANVTSANMGHSLQQILGLNDAEERENMRIFASKEVSLVELKEPTIYADYLQHVMRSDLIIIAERHTSAKGVASFATHAEGNWSAEAKLGGKPKTLSVAAPLTMLSALNLLNKSKQAEIQLTYEATHHGPLLDIPSLYLEVGGNDQALNSKELAHTVASAIAHVTEREEPEYDKIALGIGGTHYPAKFTALALQGKYAFSHIMPGYHASEYKMLAVAAQRSDPKPEVAIIEWKSIKAQQRNQILGVLEEIGMEYVRI